MLLRDPDLPVGLSREEHRTMPVQEPKVERRTDNFEYWKSAFIRICVTDPNIEGSCKILEIVPNKGTRIAFSKIRLAILLKFMTTVTNRL